MVRTGVFLLVVPLVLLADGLDGTITGGKAKAHVDKARPLARQGDALYRAWRLDEIAEADLVEHLKTIVKLYEQASDLLQKALDIQEDSGALGMQRILCRRLVRLRAQLFYRRAPKPKPKPEPETKPEPESDQPKPEPKAQKPRPAADADDADDDLAAPPPPPTKTFAKNEPPASPVDIDLPVMASEEDIDESVRKGDHAAIKRLLKDAYQARKQNKLHARHRLCRGNGCEACGGTGRQINLYHFRKVFWNCYSPTLRSSPGALDALKAFYARAQKDIAALGPAIKSFSIKDVRYHGYWAKVTIEENTTDGKQTRTVTVISAGFGWCFYCPDTDKEFLPT